MNNKTFNILLVFFLLGGCTKQVNEFTIDTKTKLSINKTFNNWVDAKIKMGYFFAKDSCNMDYYLNASLDSESIVGIAVPWDSSEIKFYYAELNNDNKLDALVTFIPYQCDGGNSSMWLQYQLLILSQDSSYILVDNYFDKHTREDGFLILTGADNMKVYGTYYEFSVNDGFCCPSIKETTVFDLGGK